MTAVETTATDVPLTTPALELRNVSSGYGETTILRGINLTVEPGSVTALLGSNGAGKTTLLSTASGLLRPRVGQVLLNDLDVTHLSTSKRCDLGLCHIPEGRAVFRSLSVRENLRLQAAPGEEEATLERAIIAFPILGRRLSQGAGTLSGGEQQMLALAAAYARHPKLVLVDEASLGLAPVIVDQIFAFLEGLRSSGASLLLVDQFITRALSLADRAYVLSKGVLVFEGAPSQLLASDVFHRYLGGG